jgi:hypothetical protein
MSTATFAVGAGLGVASLALYFRPPPALPNRLADIDEDDVRIDNECYDDTDWWEVRSMKTTY